MSGITTVVVKTGQYKCISCLEAALERLKLRYNIKILQEQREYRIGLQEETERYYKHQVEVGLKAKIKNYHKKILPVYTELHAIHSLTEKGFKHVKTYQQDNGYKLIFEKVVGTGIDERFERYEIRVLPNENRIIIDGGDMPGNYCRQYARKFQRSMGEFESFIPYSSTQDRTIKETVKTKQHIEIKRR